MKVIPTATVPSDQTIIYFAESYYKLGEKEKGHEVISELLNKVDKNLNWFLVVLDSRRASSAIEDIYMNMRMLQGMVSIAETYDTELFDTYSEKLARYFQLFNSVN
jgi:hypothetical protein